jgi:hypothetical protein
MDGDAADGPMDEALRTLDRMAIVAESDFAE